LINSNIKSNQQQSQQNINQVINFMQHWELEKKMVFFMIDVKIRYTESGECKIIKKPSWPCIKSPKERVWEKFYSSILESVSRTFYPERNLQGNIIESSDDDPRVRDFKTERITERVKSPIRQQDQYLLPFSAEAVDELFSDTIKKNTSQIYIRRNREGKTITKLCNFKDELSGVAIAVEWDNTFRTLEFFKTKLFDYLFKTQYIQEPIKAEMSARSEGIIREKIQLSPKIPTDNFTAANDKDYSAYK
jgi:hypothetical protein